MCEATFFLQTSRENRDVVDFEVPRQALLIDQRRFYDPDASERDGFNRRIQFLATLYAL